MSRILHEHGALLALFEQFFFSPAGQNISGQYEYNRDQQEHGQPPVGYSRRQGGQRPGQVSRGRARHRPLRARHRADPSVLKPGWHGVHPHEKGKCKTRSSRRAFHNQIKRK